tara:strand:- start:4642 stop:5889 length:1248 start_codon:yes stop_codon:yes gene_type:complete
MSGWERLWRPAAMAQIENSDPVPAGFESASFAGIGMTCKMIEPSKLESKSDWLTIVSELKPWGRVPEHENLEVTSLTENERGPIAILRGDSEWVAEFLPWGSDGLLRKRAKSANTICEAPCGGYIWEGIDVILIRQGDPDETSLITNLSESMQSDDLDASRDILWGCGNSLGRYHQAVESARTTPPDPRRWNKRIEGLEASLRSQSIWRAPHSRDSDCMLGIGDLRFEDFIGGTIRIGRPRLSDALHPPDCEFPAIRDLSSLVHDLSRLHFENSSQLDIVELRSSLIRGWRDSAPEKWCSDEVFYSHRGGLAVWEYEQCLLDIIEAVSHQSGAPQPATTIIGYVTPYQKRMFNNRTFGALSMMAAFFGLASLVNTFPPSFVEIPIPLASIVASILLLRYYRGLAPPPEIPFTRFA